MVWVQSICRWTRRREARIETTGWPSMPRKSERMQSFARLHPSHTVPRLASPAPTVCYAVGGRAIVHSNLTLALSQFTAMSSRGPAELLPTEDA
jgi:hypothetical protein